MNKIMALISCRDERDCKGNNRWIISFPAVWWKLRARGERGGQEWPRSGGDNWWRDQGVSSGDIWGEVRQQLQAGSWVGAREVGVAHNMPGWVKVSSCRKRTEQAYLRPPRQWGEKEDISSGQTKIRSWLRKDQGQAFCKDSRETSFPGGPEHFWMRVAPGSPPSTEHSENFQTSSRYWGPPLF